MMVSKPPPIREYLYAECTCGDFEWNQHRYYELEHFLKRLETSRRVMVARHTDLLIPPEMAGERDEKYCMWRDEMNIIHALTITREERSRAHRVSMTLNAGGGCEWICKHVVSAARKICRLKFRFNHVFAVHRDDENRDMKEKLEWARHQAGGPVDAVWMRLDQNVAVGGWGKDESRYVSNLFGQKGEERK